MCRPLEVVGHFLAARLALSLLFRFRIEDLSGGPHEGPVLVIGKHVSYWDIPCVSRGLRRALPGAAPYFEMGSFQGYPFLERVNGFLKLNGAFPVMRPKDLIRIKKAEGLGKDEVKALMRQVNEEAAATRRMIFEDGDAVCYFPEGTRDREKVAPLRSLHEIEEALAFERARGREPLILPMLPCYAPKPRFFLPFLNRQRALLRILPPIETKGLEATEVLAAAQQALEDNWLDAEATKEISSRSGPPGASERS